MPDTPSTTDSVNDKSAYLYLKVFDDPHNGTPDNITQAGCLALLHLGGEVWNAWREKYPVQIIRLTDGTAIEYRNIVDFSNIDFEKRNINNFHTFKFGNGARFIEAKFGNNAFFFEAEFGNNANFSKTKFGKEANFKDTRFGENASFYKAKFREEVNFNKAEFGDNAYFSHANFDGEAYFTATLFKQRTDFSFAKFKKVNFSRAKFGNWTSFSYVSFLKEKANPLELKASFYCTQFGRGLRFDGAYFGNVASFEGAQFGVDTCFRGVQFDKTANFYALNKEQLAYVHREFNYSLCSSYGNWSNDNLLSSPNTFSSICFDGATFVGSVDFSGRKFEGSTSFGRLSFPMDVQRQNLDGEILKQELPEGHPVIFGQAPLFHNCKFHQDTTFEGAQFPDPSSDSFTNETAARAYRTLKLAFAKHQATREEQRFFRLEMTEEAILAPITQRWLFKTYHLISNYGFSLSRPIGLLLCVQIFFLIIYGWLASLSPCFFWQTNCSFNYTWLEFGLLQTIPLPGMDTWSKNLQSILFPEDVINGLTAAVVLHKLTSIFFLFFIGLALRNLFKMK